MLPASILIQVQKIFGPGPGTCLKGLRYQSRNSPKHGQSHQDIKYSFWESRYFYTLICNFRDLNSSRTRERWLKFSKSQNLGNKSREILILRSKNITSRKLHLECIFRGFDSSFTCPRCFRTDSSIINLEINKYTLLVTLFSRVNRSYLLVSFVFN